MKYNTTPPIVWAADLETFSAESEYWKRTNSTRMYIASYQQVPATYDREKPGYVFKKEQPVRLSTDFEDMFNNIFYDNIHQKPRMSNLVFFHNGIEFDYKFILDWLLTSEYVYVMDNNWFVDRKGVMKKHKSENFFITSKIPSFMNLFICKWIPEKNKHAVIELADSLKIIQGSIKTISEDYVIKWNDKKKEWKHGVMYDWVIENHLDLEKLRKVDEFSPNDVYDMDNYYIYSHEAGRLPIKAFNTGSGVHMYGGNVATFKARVVNDTYILSAVIAYSMIFNGITIADAPAIRKTSASYALNTFTHEYCLEHPELKDKDGKYPKSKELWEHILRIKYDDKLKVNSTFLDWRTGGFCSYNEDYLKKKIDVKVMGGYIFSYDVNSLYPSICMKNALPYGKYKKLKKLPKNYKDKFIFVHWKCSSIKQLVTNCCNMIHRSWVHDEEQPIYRRTVNGDVECFDILAAYQDIWSNTNYFEMLNVYDVEYYVFDKEPYLQKIMKEKYEIKRTSSGIRKIVAKLVMNSLTGKPAQSEFQKATLEMKCLKTIFKDADELFNSIKDVFIYEKYIPVAITKEYVQDKWNKDENIIYIDDSSEIAYSYYPLYCAITLLGRYVTRITQLKFCFDNPEALVLYSDTDSIKGWTPNKLFDSSIVSEDEAGLWKEEFKSIGIKEFMVIKPKFWLTDLYMGDKAKDIAPCCATSGIKTKELIEHMNNQPIEYILTHHEVQSKEAVRVNGGVLIIDKLKDILQGNEEWK